ncbi:MAG: phage tail tape measure protein [Xanthomonadaceae bacterium]|nr:phage tail tape measure protein [Xanthomonadaceae bacterium]
MSSKLAIGVTLGAVLGATYDRAFNGATSRVNQLGDAMRSFKSQRGLTEAFDRDEAAVGKARVALEKAQREVMAVKKALKADPNNQALAKALEKTEKNAAELAGKLNSARVAAAKSGQAMRQAGLDAAKSAQEHVRLGAAIDKVEQEQKQLNAVMSRRNQASARIGQLRNQLLGLTGVAFAAGKAIGQALDIERAEVRLSTVVNADDVDAAVKASRRSAIEFARSNLTAEGDILNIEYALNSAGFEASFARSTSGLVSKVAKVTDGSAEQVGEVMATVFNNLGGSLKGTQEEQITRIGELLTKTQFKFQIRDFGQLGESFKTASPTLARFNVELDQGATLIGALNSAGIQGGAAGTALSASFRQLGKASEQMGFQIAKNAQGGIDFIATLENLSQSIGGFESISDDTNAALQKAFGDEGVKGVVLLGKQLDKLRAAQQDVTEGSKGLVDKSYQRFLDSASGKTEIFQNNVRLLGTAFGAALLPALNTVLPPLVSIAAGAGQLLERFPVIATVIGGVVGGVALWTAAVLAANAATWLWNSAILGLPFSKLAGGLGKATAAIRAGGSGFGGALSAVGRSLPFVGRALLLITRFTPLGLAIGAVAAVVIKFWSPIKAFFAGVWNGLIEGARPVLDALGEITGVIAPVFRAVGSLFGDLLAPVQLGEESLSGFAAAGRLVGAALALPFTAVRILGQGLGWLAFQAQDKLFPAIKTLFAFSPLGLIVNNWNAIIGFLKTLPTTMPTIGGQIIDGLLGGIMAGWDRLKAGVTNIGDGIATQFKSVLGIQSPSRVFMGLGNMLGLGLQQGMLGTAKVVAGAALALATAATPSFPGSVGPGVDAGAQSIGASVVGARAQGAVAPAVAAGGAPPTASTPAAMEITIGPINITQQSGEDAEALADRVAAAIERKAGRIRRSALGDIA